MKARLITEGIYWMGAIDWDRRLFDAFMPLPDGTSYNAYLVRGSEKTALIDTVDCSMGFTLLSQLRDIPKMDYIIIQHAEQDHAGALPQVIERFDNAEVLTTPSGRDMILELFCVPEARIRTVADGDVVSLGDKNLKIVYTPWVNWPECFMTYVTEEKILFTSDFFSSHLAATDLFADDQYRTREAAKRYYAGLLMPFRKLIRKNLEKIREYQVELIAPHHGLLYDQPLFIMESYLDWTSDIPKNNVVIPYVSMYGSTESMAQYVTTALAEQGVKVFPFNMLTADVGKMAMALVDAATIVFGTPTVNFGPHPEIYYGAHLADSLRPKTRFASIIGSYGWRSEAVEQVSELLPNLHVEILPPVLAKGYPKEEALRGLDNLAGSIAEKHLENGFI